MKALHEYYGTGSTYYSSSSQNRKLVYADIPDGEKKKLDKMSMEKFGRKFVDCGFEEQSGIRSLYQAANHDPEEIKDVEDDIEKDGEDEKAELKKSADQAAKDEPSIEDEDEEEAADVAEAQGPCWDGYERVPGTKEGEKGSCRKVQNEEDEDEEEEAESTTP